MLNQTVIVGRLTDLKKDKTENGADKVIITLAVPQTFKNTDGIYDTNFIECSLFGNVGKNTYEWCNKGDLIGVKARIQKLKKENPLEIIAEKISFLSSNIKERKEVKGE